MEREHKKYGATKKNVKWKGFGDKDTVIFFSFSTIRVAFLLKV